MSWSSWSESITKIAREAQRGIDKEPWVTILGFLITRALE